jgi:hypothetical protein
MLILCLRFFVQAAQEYPRWFSCKYKNDGVNESVLRVPARQ